MNKLDLYSEPYGSTGNIGENFRRLLGAPALGPLQTLIREAVQNIADAAKLGHGPEILIRLRTLSREQLEILREVILREEPREPKSCDLLKLAVSRNNLTVLEICDFRTTGLGGPTRSDRIPIGTERTDFIDFLRNIGTPRDTEHGGGTYGFGKVALYRASRCATILVDTLPHATGPKDRRLIGCHVGHSFGIPENGMLRKYTGRHWWGVADAQDGVVDPVTGDQAAELATALGFPDRDDGRTGTSIMIIDFETEDEDLHVSGNRIVEALLWNFWPRLMRDVPDSRRFVCKVEVEGADVPVPAPEDIAPFDLFCKAMRAARSRSGHDVRPIESQWRQKLLGTLAIERGLRSPRRPLVGEGTEVPAVVHHVALMRPVELVVKYLEGTPLPDERLEWAGVFLASGEGEVERAFADSEPPAHDDWIPDNLPAGNARRYVKFAMKRLRGIASEMGIVAPGRPIGSSSGPPLARLAGRLGAILEDVGGDGAGSRRPKGNGGGGSRSGRARASRPIFDRLELGDAGRIAVFKTEVTQDKQRSGATLSASVSIAIDGTAAGRIDEDIEQPVVVSIVAADGHAAAEGARIPLHGHEGSFELRVFVPDDCAVTVDAEILSEPGE
ncbi:hypothetical protein NKH72_17100 [Mesorhizobium sp. M0955]|uniref:hypothetical protein n=1 Tax=Mesorhizobium sp. M0955 TaxID=2957033 RepID=UPI003337CED1